MGITRAADSNPHRDGSSDLPSDVSELAGWSPARRVADPSRAKIPTRRVTINLDEDLVAIFKADALLGGPPYQVAINQALRAFLRQRERSERETAVEIVLTALEDEGVRRKVLSLR